MGTLKLTALLVLTSLYLTGFRWYSTPTISMAPTIQKDEHFVVHLSENYRDNLKRMDIAIYKPVDHPDTVYAKRIIGLPGEHVTIDQNGVSINGSKLALPDSVNRSGLGNKPCDMMVPNDAVFMLGDNTANSFDSRYSGPVPPE